MTLAKALAFFFREAWTSLRRSWRVWTLAILTIAVSLYVGGLFLLVGHNLGAAAAEWRSEARIVAYLRLGSTTASAEALAVWARAQPGVADVRVVSAEDAEQRFTRAFPSLSEALEMERRNALPPSVEVATEPQLSDEALEQLVSELEARGDVDLVDDDRDWLARLDTVVLLTRSAGLFLGALLLAAAVFTIYSVIRLTAYLYREEIEVMRLVGATELMVRGPFYLEGLLQGALGAVVALVGLASTHALLLHGSAGGTFVGRLVLGRFVPWPALLSVVALGAAAGLLGAALSVGPEIARAEEP